MSLSLPDTDIDIFLSDDFDPVCEVEHVESPCSVKVVCIVQSCDQVVLGCENYARNIQRALREKNKKWKCRGCMNPVYTCWTIRAY